MKKSNCGKWILSGEHSVLRGGPIILFPMYQKRMEIEYLESQEFHCSFEKGFLNSQSSVFQQAIEQAFVTVRQKKRGIFQLRSDIPLGCGVGSSAAFCLSISQIFFEQSWISDVLDFAMDLENFFHGKSSGADVLVSYHQQPLLFKKKDSIEKLHLLWKPPLYLYNTQCSELTKNCVHQVSQFHEKFPKESRMLDQQMNDSVHLALQSLTIKTKNPLESLQQSMDKAYDCFKKWSLLKNLESKTQELKQQGALSVKPTGAGGGGFLLSLWKKPLSQEWAEDHQLIPVEYY